MSDKTLYNSQMQEFCGYREDCVDGMPIPEPAEERVKMSNLTTEHVKAAYLYGSTGLAHGVGGLMFDQWLESVRLEARNSVTAEVRMMRSNSRKSGRR